MCGVLVSVETTFTFPLLSQKIIETFLAQLLKNLYILNFNGKRMKLHAVEMQSFKIHYVNVVNSNNRLHSED